MKHIKHYCAIIASIFLLASTSNAVPEYFFQSGENELNAQAAYSYTMTDTDPSFETTDHMLSFWMDYGLTKRLALRFGGGYGMLENDFAGATQDINGFTDFSLDIIGHHMLGEAMRLHYGIEGDITLDKNSTKRMSGQHAFNPYVGFSMGNEMIFGGKLAYNSITTDGDVLGNANYTVSAFAEMQRESFVAGASLDYQQLSGFDDFAAVNLYGRMHFGEKMAFIPKLRYGQRLDDEQTKFTSLQAYLGLRYKFK